MAQVEADGKSQIGAAWKKISRARKEAKTARKVAVSKNSLGRRGANALTKRSKFKRTVCLEIKLSE